MSAEIVVEVATHPVEARAWGGQEVDRTPGVEIRASYRPGDGQRALAALEALARAAREEIEANP